jgi:hypothetical protein
MNQEEVDSVVPAAAALLHAAILLRDLSDAMPIQVKANMPPDLLNRMMHHRYQSAFDKLPQEVAAIATTLVTSDPDAIAARLIDKVGKPSDG